jgi:hypothetical protein
MPAVAPVKKIKELTLGKNLKYIKESYTQL